MNPEMEVISPAAAILLDFDGPITWLMPPPRNADAAERTHGAARVPFPKTIEESTDHIAVLTYLLDQPLALSRALYEALRA